MKRQVIRWSVLMACGCVLVVAGCSPPKGDSGGRVDVYETTEADKRSSSASLPALYEFSDKTAESLARDLSEIPEISKRDQRAVLELGGIVNKTGTTIRNFELIQRRIQNQLLKSKHIGEYFMIVEAGDRMDAEQARITGEQAGKGTARYSPEDTYVLLGDMYQANRGDMRRYYLTFKLTHLASRKIVFTEDYDLGQQ